MIINVIAFKGKDKSYIEDKEKNRTGFQKRGEGTDHR